MKARAGKKWQISIACPKASFLGGFCLSGLVRFLFFNKWKAENLFSASGGKLYFPTSFRNSDKVGMKEDGTEFDFPPEAERKKDE